MHTYTSIIYRGPHMRTYTTRRSLHRCMHSAVAVAVGGPANNVPQAHNHGASRATAMLFHPLPPPSRTHKNCLPSASLPRESPVPAFCCAQGTFPVSKATAACGRKKTVARLCGNLPSLHISPSCTHPFIHSPDLCISILPNHAIAMATLQLASIPKSGFNTY